MSLNVIADAVAGTAHEAIALPCQDKYAVCQTGEVICAALCDGAGSRENSHLGAQAVSTAVADKVSRMFEELWRFDDCTAADRIVGIAQSALKTLDYQMDELMCTLVFFASDGVRWLCGNIGDGMVFGCSEEPRVILRAHRGTYRNETYFVSEKDAALNLRLSRGNCHAGEAFFLTTDGAGNLLYDEAEQAPAPAVKEIYGWVTTLDAFRLRSVLHENLSEQFRSATCDDVSMIIIFDDDCGE